ncbi:hypothetical protein HDU91_007049 [Kappamyces sp. JEL0680]|nr:hypothetical protein HDU91_007049 [Kappamyces sp. JEL0680]
MFQLVTRALPFKTPVEAVPERGHWLGPEQDWANDPKAVCILFIHGGGFCIGDSLQYNDAMAEFLAIAGKRDAVHARFFSLEYPLAPEYKYPIPLDMALDTYQWLLATGIPSSKLVLCGDSAGGLLVFTLLQRLAERNIQLPNKAIAISPWLHPHQELHDYQPAPLDYVMAGNTKKFAESAFPADAPLNMLETPLDWLQHVFSRVPLMVTYGGIEVLRNQSQAMIQRIRLACQDSPQSLVQEDVDPNMPHVYQCYGSLMFGENARAGMERLIRFIEPRHLH